VATAVDAVADVAVIAAAATSPCRSPLTGYRVFFGQFFCLFFFLSPFSSIVRKYRAFNPYFIYV
jgi:hypothetical protein